MSMVDELCELLPKSHQVVAKMGVGRSAPFALLDDMNRLDALDAGVALVRANLAMDAREVAFYATDLGLSEKRPIIQEISLEDDLWAHKVPADLTGAYKETHGKELDGSLNFGDDKALLDWTVGTVLPGANPKKLAKANAKAYELVRAAYRAEDTEAKVKSAFSLELLTYLHDIGFVGYCNRHICGGKGSILAPQRRFEGDIAFYAEKVANGDFDMVDFFDRLSKLSA